MTTRLRAQSLDRALQAVPTVFTTASSTDEQHGILWVFAYPAYESEEYAAFGFQPDGEVVVLLPGHTASIRYPQSVYRRARQDLLFRVQEAFKPRFIPC